MKDEYRRLYYNPFKAASIQQVDEIIEPRQTREKIYTALKYFWNKTGGKALEKEWKHAGVGYSLKFRIPLRRFFRRCK